MLKKILLVPVVAVAAFAIYVAMQPADFAISRSAVIAAPPEKVFPQVNDFHKWEHWSPWAKLDPNAKNSFEGPESGKDAVFKWSGNSEVGEGKMTITESRPSDLVRLRLDFMKPMESSADTTFTFEPAGDQTKVTWTMTGKNNFIGRAICMFMNMDKMVGGKFDEGLQSMKKVVEGGDKPPAAAYTDTPTATASPTDKTGEK